MEKKKKGAEVMEESILLHLWEEETEQKSRSYSVDAKHRKRLFKIFREQNVTNFPLFHLGS